MRLHHFAIALAVVCYSLLLLGGHVHNTGASLACGTDWPRCHGEWMPVMKGGVFFEHSHRILAALVGLGSVILAVALGVADRRRGERGSMLVVLSVVGFVLAQLAGLVIFASTGARHGEAIPGDVPVLFSALAFLGLLTFGAGVAVAFQRSGSLLGWGLVAVGLVAAQGMLGALTVAVGLSPVISTLHLGTSMLFFGTLLVIAYRSLPPGPPRAPLPERTRRLVLVTIALVYLQMILGAVVRHLGAGMICGASFPLCFGHVWPAEGHPGIYLHILHRALGLLLLAHVFGVWMALRKRSSNPSVRRAGMALLVLLAVQVILGIVAVYTVLNAHVVTTHLGVAAAIFAVLVWLAAAPSVASGDSSQP